MKKKILSMLLLMALIGSQTTVGIAAEDTGMENVESDVQENASIMEEITLESGDPVSDVQDSDEKNFDENAGIEILANEDEISARAAEELDSGECGDNLTWVLSADGTLTISGQGEMVTDRGISYGVPWGVYSNDIQKVEIESGVTSIGEFAFANTSNLSEIIIPEGVTSIGSDAFSYSGLTSIVLPESLTTVGNTAFAGSSLTEITLPDSVVSIGESVFEDCKSLVGINLSNGLTNIPSGAFAGCVSLASIDIPDNITSIGSSAFFNTGLKSVTVPEAVTQIGENALGYEGDIYGPSKVEGFLIYGYPDTAAETYANDNSFIFEPLQDSKLEIVTDKTDEVYIKGTGGGATIYCTGDLNEFISAEMDGELVDPSNYTLEEGSTVLTFSSAYLDTLSVGEHTVTLNYIDESISMTLTILENTNAENAGMKPSWGRGEGTGHATVGSAAEESNTSVNNAVNKAVKTGDQINLAKWAILMLVSTAVCASVVVKRKDVKKDYSK